MSVEAFAGETVKFTTPPWGVTGLVGTIGIALGDGAGATVLARQVAGIVEWPAASTIYIATVAIPAGLAPGRYVAAWDAAGAFAEEDLRVLSPQAAAARAVNVGPDYAVAADLRGELELTPADLSDAKANRLIRDASDTIDRLLAAWPVNPATGRRLDLSKVTVAQAIAVTRATVTLAAAEQRSPGAFAPADAASVEGPDFKRTGLAVGVVAGGAELALRRAYSLLRGAGLVVTAARARA